VQVAQRTEDRSSVFRTFEFARFTFYADSTRRTPAGQRRQNSKSPWDRAYPLTQLPTPRRAAIAALNYAAVAIEFSQRSSSRGSVSISLRLQVITGCFLVVVTSSLI
jgi:hypothetical protein